MEVLTDAEVRAISPEVAVAAMREALVRYAEGRLLAPPRVQAGAGPVDYIFTVGGLVGEISGFRAYRAGPNPGDQLVAVWDPDGTLAGVVIGDELGARRTGALGAVAADVLAQPAAEAVGIVGSGRQAWAQLWALTAVRRLASVRVYSPWPKHREAFAARARDELGLSASPAATAAEAVRGADIVVVATLSERPVITVGEVSLGAHVTTVGPKLAWGHEVPAALAAAAAIVTCDSPAQARSYSEPFFINPAMLISLGDVVTGRVPGRRADEDITLYCSVGLAGSEVLLAQRLIHPHSGSEPGTGPPAIASPAAPGPSEELPQPGHDGPPPVPGQVDDDPEASPEAPGAGAPDPAPVRPGRTARRERRR